MIADSFLKAFNRRRYAELTVCDVGFVLENHLQKQCVEKYIQTDFGRV